MAKNTGVIPSQQKRRHTATERYMLLAAPARGALTDAAWERVRGRGGGATTVA